MKNIILASIIALIVGGIAGFVLKPAEPVSFAGTTNLDRLELSEGLSVTGATSFLTDTTFSGGTVNVTTSNTATSTLVVGCVQFYATSTATALKYQASTTPGIMYSQYGTCPNL